MKANEKDTKPDETAVIRKLSLVGIIGNVFLSAFKFIAGIMGNSSAMVSDAVHSLSDVFATFIAFLGVRFGRREADASHPYGHERMECVAAIILATILCLTGLGLGYSAIGSMSSGEYAELSVPGSLALAAAVISIAVKEWMYHYTRINAKRVDSGALMADAWHHRSDALSSVGALIGIIAARLGFSLGDPIASLVICVLIVKAAYDIFKDAVDKMVDKSCDDEFEAQLRECVLENKSIRSIGSLHTRVLGNKVYVDLVIRLDAGLDLSAAHSIAEDVHNSIESAFPKVKHIMIHTEPEED